MENKNKVFSPSVQLMSVSVAVFCDVIGLFLYVVLRYRRTLLVLVLVPYSQSRGPPLRLVIDTQRN